jgi:hypothetical protein
VTGPRINNIIFLCCYQIVRQFVGLGPQVHCQVAHARRSPLQGALRCAQFPGLKPWAMIYSRFAAQPMDAQAVRC